MQRKKKRIEAQEKKLMPPSFKPHVNIVENMDVVIKVCGGRILVLCVEFAAWRT